MSDLPVDAYALREEVKAKYRAVALDPHGGYHFHPESAGYQQFCDQRHAFHRLWQRQIAVAAGKERSRPPTEALHC